MEYCELGDLSLFIKKRDKLLTNPATHEMARKYPSTPGSGLHEVVIRHFLKQLASALKFLRESNFIHRDVKPQNLLLLPSQEYRDTHKSGPRILTASNDSLIPVAGLPSLPMLKLADFGFARVLPSTTLAETLCGSPLYMAPEILRYERYDAKADLWSVGTVLYEMISGRPPFRASNHVELLRKIEVAEDVIKFPRESMVSPEMKALTRALLKRNPVERISYENFFSNTVITSPIPGLVEDDVPKPEREPGRVPDRVPGRRSIRDLRGATKSEDTGPSTRRLSYRRDTAATEPGRDSAPPSPRDQPRRPEVDVPPQQNDAPPVSPQLGHSPRQEPREGLGIRRPPAQPSSSAPNRSPMYDQRRHRLSNASLKQPLRETPPSGSAGASEPVDEREKAAQDIAFERDYVVVEKKQVEVNAFADEMAANPRLATQGTSLSPKSGQMIRRATQQGNPTSTTGAVPSAPSRAMQIAQGGGRPSHERRGSLSGSPGSTTSFITKAIHDASLRLLGVKYPASLIGKGSSPPQLYNPFPSYPTPAAPAGLIGPGKQSSHVDEDGRFAQLIEDYATRSDVVYGFAEVKYKQLVPLAPSVDYGLGAVPADKLSDDEDGLTTEAIVTLSEESLVLYVKALSLLARSMDIASCWWSEKTRKDGGSANGAVVSARELGSNLVMRINSLVQWIRSRFNEVLEKAEVVRLKLVEAQKQLPEDHPSHPSNHPGETGATKSATAEGVVITAGTTAEKLMYDRAMEMSRAAAINELATEDLPGCELSYVTALRMLEAIVENDDDVPKRRGSGSRAERAPVREADANEVIPEDQEFIQKSRPPAADRQGHALTRPQWLK